MIKYLSILLALLFFSSAPEKPLAVDEAPFTRTISVRLEQGLMFTDVTIKGEVYNFLIDTGAPFLFSPELADKLGFNPEGTSSVGSSNTRNGTAQVGTYRGTVEVGGLKFSDFKALVIDYNANTQVIRCLDFDGIIGANFMGGAIWQMDYDNQKIIITNQLRKLPMIKESWSTKMEKRGFNKSPYIGVRVNKGSNARVLFDSGFSGFFDLPYTVYDRALKEGKIDESIKIVEGRGLMSEGVMGADDTTGYYMQVPRLVIGKEVIEKPDFIMSHTRQTKVGVEYLRGRLVTFDFPRKRFYVYEKENNYSPVNKESFLFGVSLTEGRLTVSSIYQGKSDAHPLQIGDEILEVNGRKIKELDECEAILSTRDLLDDAQSLEITVLRDDEELNFKINKSLIFND